MHEQLNFSIGGRAVFDEHDELIYFLDHTKGSGAARLHHEATALAALTIALDGQTLPWTEIEDHPALQEVPLAVSPSSNAYSEISGHQLLPSPADTTRDVRESVPDNDILTTKPLNTRTVKALANHFPEYVKVEGRGRKATVSVRNIGVAVLRQTAKEADATSLRYARQDKLHLFDYAGMSIRCGENIYGLILDESAPNDERQAAIITARIIQTLHKRAKDFPQSPYITPQRLADSIWEQLPPHEKQFFIYKLSTRQITDVFRSAVAAIQYREDNEVVNVFSAEVGRYGLNPKINPDLVQFELSDKPIDLTETTELEDGFVDTSVDASGYEDNYHLPAMTEVTGRWLNGDSPTTHEDAIQLLDSLMNPRLRTKIEKELSVKISRDQLEQAHDCAAKVLGYDRYYAAVRARTIKGNGFVGRIMQIGGMLDGSKTLKRIGETKEYEPR